MWLSTIRRSAHWIAVTCETAMPMTTRMSRRRERREVAQEAIARVHDGGGERDGAAARHNSLNLAATRSILPSQSVDRCVNQSLRGVASDKSRPAGSLYSCAGTDERRAAAAATAAAAAAATATGRSVEEARLREKKSVQEVIAEESASRAEEIKAEFIAKHRQLQSEIRILPHGAAIDRLFGVVSQGARTVVAFDFDQTLTFVAAGADGQREKGLRGGNAARSALRGLHAAGVRMAIVTAQSPSLQTVRTLSGELHALGIAELFSVPADGAREAVLDALAEWGDHAALPPERLLARLVLLLLLKSDRSAADLARISLSQTRGVVSPAAADDEVDALCCKLRALGGGGDDARPRRRRSFALPPTARGRGRAPCAAGRHT